MRGQNPFSFEIPPTPNAKQTVGWSENLESFESEGSSQPCDPSDDLEVVEFTGNGTPQDNEGGRLGSNPDTPKAVWKCDWGYII